MAYLRHLPRTAVLAAVLLLAALVFAIERTDGVGDALETGVFSSFLSIGAGLVVAAVVLSRVSPRR